MASDAIERLLSELRNAYGAALARYGPSAEEEHGTAFTLAGIPATFSVHTREGALPYGHYDIQVEGSPPGEYLYTMEGAIIILQTARPG